MWDIQLGTRIFKRTDHLFFLLHSWNVSPWHSASCPIYRWRGAAYDVSAGVHLEMSPLALVCLLTTRGSLTYIGSYISGAKSTLENSQVSSGTWAMSWMFGQKEGLNSFPQAFFFFFESGPDSVTCCSVAGTHQVINTSTIKGLLALNTFISTSKKSGRVYFLNWDIHIENV